MNLEKINRLLKAFQLPIEVTNWRAYGHGHINDTYLLETTRGIPDFILQRKNHQIFKNIEGMMRNIVIITNHIRKQLLALGEQEIDRKVMHYLSDPGNNYFVLDEEGNYWTIALFIGNSKSIEEVTHPDQAFRAGEAFGHFQLQLATLDGALLVDTIPDFHNGNFRYQQFKDSIAGDAAGRVDEMKPYIEVLLARAEEMTRLQAWLDSGEIPLRTTHNDTKINNILFDDQNNALCIIDLDTVMPGSALFDFGDAIRTLGNSSAEDEPDTDRIRFNRDYFQSFAEGYLSQSKRFLTPLEIENLAFGCRYMVWEQTIRFLTDYLNGDTYYKIAYPLHNKIRTLAQFRYLEVLDQEAEFMQSVVIKSSR